MFSDASALVRVGWQLLPGLTSQSVEVAALGPGHRLVAGC
jgi:hypothetical protein